MVLMLNNVLNAKRVCLFDLKRLLFEHIPRERESAQQYKWKRIKCSFVYTLCIKIVALHLCSTMYALHSLSSRRLYHSALDSVSEKEYV